MLTAIDTMDNAKVGMDWMQGKMNLASIAKTIASIAVYYYLKP